MKLGVTALKILQQYLKRSDGKTKKTWVSRDSYEHIDDVDAYGDGDFFHQFDVFYAPKDKQNGCTIIDIHGGAYVYGDRKNNFGFATVFLEKGYNVILLDYPQTRGRRNCLDQIHVLGAQLGYIQTHAEELKIDAGKLFLYGDSAGGHYALLIAECADNEELSSQVGVNLQGISFLGVGLSCPVFDVARTVMTPAMNERAKAYMFGKQYRDESYVRLISPKVHLDVLKTPVFLNSCPNDFLKQESFDLNEDLKKRGGLTLRFVFESTTDKAVQHVYNVMQVQLPESKRVNEEIHRFFADIARG